LVSRDFSERLLNKQNGGVGRGHEKTNCRQFVGKTMNVKKGNVDFRVSRIIVIGKGDIIIILSKFI
jgi:ketosteroid isomerase-like protein